MPEAPTKAASLPIAGHAFVIVGGASLVGSATARLLLERGARRVTIVDNFFQGSAKALDGLDGDRRVKIVTGDVLRLPEILVALDGADGVLHLAALMTITMDQNPWLGLDVNIRGLHNTLEACRHRGVKKIILSSSAGVFA